MKNLSGKIVIITGAGSGLGRTIARYFSRRNASVVVSDIDISKAEETLSQRLWRNGL